MSVLQEVYEAHHREGGRYGFTVGEARRTPWIKARVGNGNRMLDIGCRDGTLTRHFVQDNSVVGVDIDAQALVRVQKELGIETQVLDINAGKFPFEDASFDRVVAGEVLEHTQFPWIPVDEIFRILRPGGRFIGSVPNAFRLKNRIEFLFGRDFEVDPTHLHQFSPQAIRKLLGQFSSVEIEYLGGRRRNLHPRLFGAHLMWCAEKA